MASKDQERQAIGKIMVIVGDLGEDSYLGAAMDGVLEMAEDNIANDAMFSFKEDAEQTKEKLEDLRNEYDCIRTQLVGETKYDKKRIELLEQRAERAEALVKKWRMPDPMRHDLYLVIKDAESAADKEIKLAADNMASAVGEDGIIKETITECAKMYRIYNAKKERCGQMIKMLQKYEEDGNDTEWGEFL